MRFTITHKLIFTILLFAVCSICIIFFFILPPLKSITEASEAVARHVQFENGEFERIRLLRRSLTEIRTINKKLEGITKISINKSEEENLLDTFETIAKKYNIDQALSASYHTNNDATEFPGYYLFSFTSAGLFENIRAYFAEIESIPYYANIGRVTIEKSPKLGTNSVTITFTATINSTSEL